LIDTARQLTVVRDEPVDGVAAVLTVVADFTFDRHGKTGCGSALARHLAREAVDVHRFDAEGNGLAGFGGRWGAAVWESMADEAVAVVRAAASRAASGTPRVLLGIGIGGVLAVRAAADMDARSDPYAPDGLVLVGADLVQSVRFVVTGLASVRGGEQVLPSRIFRERERLNPRDDLAELEIPVLGVVAAGDARFAGEANDLSRFGARVQVVDGVGDLLGNDDAIRALAHTILHWTDDELVRER